MSHNFLDKSASDSLALKYFNQLRHAIQGRIQAKSIDTELNAFATAYDIKYPTHLYDKDVAEKVGYFISSSPEDAIPLKIIRMIEDSYEDENLINDVFNNIKKALSLLKEDKKLDTNSRDELSSIIVNIIHKNNIDNPTQHKYYEFMKPKGF